MRFREYLKEKRIEKKLSIRKLAEMSEVSAMYISELERGKRENPSPEVLKKLSKGLDESYENLMMEAGYWDDINQFTETRIIETRALPEIQFDDLEYYEIFFKGRVLTTTEKTKIKKIFAIVLED